MHCMHRASLFAEAVNSVDPFLFSVPPDNEAPLNGVALWIHEDTGFPANFQFSMPQTEMFSLQFL